MLDLAWFWAMVCQAALASSLQLHIDYVADELNLDIDLDPDLTAMARRIADA
jgi:hypothetical protein